MNVKIINGNLLLREGDKYKVTKETLFIKNNEIFLLNMFIIIGKSFIFHNFY